MSDAFQALLAEQGTIYQRCAPHKHAGNGTAERDGRTIMESAVAAQHTSMVDKKLFCYAVMGVVQCKNRMPRADDRIPWTLAFGTPPPETTFLPYGCLVYATLPVRTRRKDRIRYELCAFLCLTQGTKDSLTLFCLDTHSVINRDSNDVFAYTSEFPFRATSLPPPRPPSTSFRSDLVEGRLLYRESSNTDIHREDLKVEDISSPPFDSSAGSSGDVRGSSSVHVHDISSPHAPSIPQSPSFDDDMLGSPGDFRGSSGVRSTSFDDNMFGSPCEDTKHERSCTEGETIGQEGSGSHNSGAESASDVDEDDTMDPGVPSVGFGKSALHSAVERPMEGESLVDSDSNNPFNNWQNFPDEAIIAMIAHHEESHRQRLLIPQTLSQAMNWQGPNSHKWREAAKTEFHSLIKNNTFRIIDREGRTTIGSRFVFAEKTNELGEVVRFKGRFVAKGFSQIQGIHYDQTYAPTLNLSSFRLLMAMAVQNGLDIEQMDVETAFLIPKLPEKEKVFLKVPQSFVDLANECGVPMKEGQVLELFKCLYGLSQASRLFSIEFTTYLKKIGFDQMPSEPCLFVRKGSCLSENVYLAIHIDDTLAIGPRKHIEVIKKLLCAKFPMKLMGFPVLWTGIKVTRGPENSISLSSPAYVQKILEEFKMDLAKPFSVPAASKKLEKGEGSPLAPDVPYRSAVGCLLWLALTTRPDIAFAVGQVARFCNCPDTSHWNAVKHILRYLKGTMSHGLVFQKQAEPLFQLRGFSDSDWCSSVERHTTGGYFFSLGVNIISWKCKVYKAICLSSMESEIVFLSFAAQEGVYLIRLIKELGWEQFSKTPITLFGDNQASMFAARSLRMSARNKHIAIRDLYVKEAVSNGLFSLIYIPTENQLADILTKPLGRVLFARFRDRLVAIALERHN